ncbi:MAG: hypothetical protein K5656_01615 [Lachnospiraceae bacterium]|nr:hypothetical protein [Lachnospiraceae bacterium]
MFKKIRKRYWYHRDRGNGRKLILCITIFILSVISCVGLGVRSAILKYQQESKCNQDNTTEVASGQAVSEDAVSGSATSGNACEVSYGVSEDAVDNAYEVDTSGMVTFLGYMSDHAYETLINLTEDKCRELGVNTAKKLDFQKTGATEFDIIGYILVGNYKVCECAYNLKSDVVTIADTTYMESDIRDIEAARRKAEADELKKEQEEARGATEKNDKKVVKKKEKKSASKKEHKAK